MAAKIHLDSETVAELEELARRRGKTVSATLQEALDLLARRTASIDGVAQEASTEPPYLRPFPHPLPPLREDPLMEMVGVDDYEPQDIDESVYG